MLYIFTGFSFILYSFTKHGFSAIENYRSKTSEYNVNDEIKIVKNTLYSVSWSVFFDSFILPYSIFKEAIINVLPMLIIKMYNVQNMK